MACQVRLVGFADWWSGDEVCRVGDGGAKGQIIVGQL